SPQRAGGRVPGSDCVSPQRAAGAGGRVPGSDCVSPQRAAGAGVGVPGSDCVSPQRAVEAGGRVSGSDCVSPQRAVEAGVGVPGSDCVSPQRAVEAGGRVPGSDCVSPQRAVEAGGRVPGSDCVSPQRAVEAGGRVSGSDCVSPQRAVEAGVGVPGSDCVSPQRAVEMGVRVLVDAEFTYLNPALRLVTLALMGRWNRAEPWVWNTYQCYLQDCLARLGADVALAERWGFCFGVKLVRGAYLEQERRLAREGGYPDPLHPTWEATNHSYQRCLDLLLELVARDGQRCQLIVASHNESSVSHALRRMEELGIARDRGAVCFGQLLGMCDHVSLALGQAGYAVYKSVPYGAVEEVLPYLVRRAQENQSVLQGIRRERDLLRRELWRRLLRRP
uniref:Proline dehydrogenase n=1 Tax=Gopherus evgoodei TaxID=1825980 RepID=A0A8C4Y4X4_9SAUR